MKKLKSQETKVTSNLKDSAQQVVTDRFTGGEWGKTSGHLPTEMALAISVNRQQLVTIQCTPSKLNFLVLGFLYSEGIISGVDDVASIRMCEDESLTEVMLSNPEYELPTQRTITSGCGSGTTFKTQEKKVDSKLVVAPEEVLSLMRQLQQQMVQYQFCGGMHGSALTDTKNLLVVAEDIGRHNTLDKIQGECLLRGLSTRDRLLLSTGRISSEMLLKAAKMEVPVAVSRHSPTGSAVLLAHDLGIALVGHARGNSLSVYSHPERLQAHQT